MKQALNLCSVVARILLKPSKENFNIPSQNNRRSGTRVCVWSHKFFCELYLCATTSRGPQICCHGIGKGRRSFFTFRSLNINAPPCPKAAALQTCPFGSSFDSTPRGFPVLARISAREKNDGFTPLLAS